MKKTTLLSVLIWMLSINFFTGNAQETKDYPVPEFFKKPYYYYDAKNLIVDLDGGQLTRDERITGYGTDETFFYTPGEKAKLRIKKGEKTNFMIRWTNDNLDPNQTFTLLKLKTNVKKQRREVVIRKDNDWSKSSSKEQINIFFKSKKVKIVINPKQPKSEKDVLRLLIVDNLEPGEYVWKFYQGELFFGVDETVDESLYKSATGGETAGAGGTPGKEYPTPDATSKVYHYLDASNETDELQNAKFDQATRKTGFKKEESYVTTPGPKSAVRIKSAPQLQFIVKAFEADDVLKEYKLYKLTTNPKTNARECVLEKQENWTGSSNKSDVILDFTQQKVKDIKNFKVRLLIVENLPPGEYVWVKGYITSDLGYSFGID